MYDRKQRSSYFKFTPGSSVALLLPCFLFFCCTPKSDPEHKGSSTKFNQYYLQGEQLYQKNCSNCHQSTGTGLGLLYPPLNKSDYMDSNVNDVICLIKNGKEGELIVNGKNFNKKMPPMPSLTNLEVAEIATYIYNTWEHNSGDLIDVKQVDSILSKCSYK
jgi:mono/diheme cytochrome c family protein